MLRNQLTQLQRLDIPNLQDGPASWTARKKPNMQFKFEGHQIENSLLLDRDQSFLLHRPSSDWVRPTLGSAKHFIKSLPTNLSPEHPHRKFQNNIYPHSLGTVIVAKVIEFLPLLLEEQDNATSCLSVPYVGVW